MNIPIKVLIADDHAIVRNGLTALLVDIPDINVIAESTNGTEVLEKLNDGVAPDIIIADLNIQTLDGISVTKQLTLTHPHTKLIILTAVDDELMILKCFEVGARGYLLKNASAMEIIFAIRQVNLGHKYISTSIGIRLLTKTPKKPAIPCSTASFDINITKREIEILSLVANGLTNSEIAEKLFTSKRTIEGYRQNLLDKTGKRNTAALINFVVRNGIID